MKYSDEEKEIISNGKEYFKRIRELNHEKKILELEYNEIPKPKAVQTDIEAQNQKLFNDQQFMYMIKYRENILQRIMKINEILDNFWIMTLFLKLKERNVIRTFVNTTSYTEMIQKLDEQYKYCEKTYTRLIPNICIELSKYIDYDQEIKVD